MKYWHNKLTLKVIFCNLFILIVILAGVELVLRLQFPTQFNLATIGHLDSVNAARYGWGFNPGELMTTFDPDICEKFFDYANDKGFRDKIRSHENVKGAYRILVLGDSVTFGGIVPADKVYTRVLEDKFEANGYNVEVINISYGGWGTDQELEALIVEGLKYKPDLILLQFCTNDLGGNNWFQYAKNDAEKGNFSGLGLKPFFYELTDDGQVIRRENIFFNQVVDSKTWLKNNVKKVVNQSEILKRLYLFYQSWGRSELNCKASFKISKNQLDQIQFVLNLSSSSSLYQWLFSVINVPISQSMLESHIEQLDEKTKDVIRKLAEDRWFHQYWSKSALELKTVDCNSYEWKLFSGLLKRILEISHQIGSDVAVFNETEGGHFEWELYWHRRPNTVQAKEHYLSHMVCLAETCKTLGIHLIPPSRQYDRARNDPHPNILGNQAMAADIMEWILSNLSATLECYKNQSSPSDSNFEEYPARSSE